MICYVYNKLGTEILHKIHCSKYKIDDQDGRIIYLKDKNNNITMIINDLPYILKDGDIDDLPVI